MLSLSQGLGAHKTRLQTSARWLQLKKVQLPGGTSFQLIQDDLLHPYCGGNKLRKLDAIMPQLQSNGISDVVSYACRPAL